MHMAANKRIRRVREHGATMVEGAIVFPLLALLIFGIIDAGLYFGENSSLSYATRRGAHAASVTGASGMADYDVLQAMKGSLAFVPDRQIERIVVFHASGWEDSPSSACTDGPGVPGGGIGACNVYTTSDFSRPAADFGDGGWAGDDNYPAWLRSDKRGTADFVGVWVRAKCMCMSGVIGSGNKLTSRTVMRVEGRTF
jgi:hypothetical protein